MYIVGVVTPPEGDGKPPKVVTFMADRDGVQDILEGLVDENEPSSRMRASIRRRMSKWSGDTRLSVYDDEDGILYFVHVHHDEK